MTLEELAEYLEPYWDENPVWRTASIKEGWATLVAQTIDDIVEVWPDLKIVQIKEKFGGLRIYTSRDLYKLSDKTQEKVRMIILTAEIASESMCEQCGKTGEVRTDIGWRRALCESHYLEKKEQRNA